MTRRSRILVIAVAAVVAITLAACGGSSNDASSSSGTKTIEVEMRDIAFSPKSIDVPAGKPVRLVFHNRGKVAHDAFIGDQKAQADHKMEMNDSGSGGMAGMDHGGGDAAAITVQPGKTGELTHTFQSGDEMLIGCHQKGHYAAGMKLTVNVG